ncbi:MAG: hypothetical protein VB078_09400 [Clostridiaceae bacterium]|nr:hypothetical protein [Clostridiaceae bacterium]
MRRSLITAVTIFIAVLVSTAFIYAEVNSQKEDVVITPTTLWGDPDAANGINIGLSTECMNHLFWDIDYTTGTDCRSNFTFKQATSKTQKGRAPSVEISSYTDGSFSFTGGSLNIDEELEYYSMLLPAKTLAKKVKNGEKLTETVYLKDYYDFYTINFYIYYPDTPSLYQTGEAQKIFNDYFKIPVLPDHQIEVSVEKDDNGNIIDITTNTVFDTPFNINCRAATTKNGAYVIIPQNGEADNRVDLSHIKGGYGIYYIPFELNEEGTKWITHDSDPVRMVYSLDINSVEAVNILASDDGTKLQLFTKENGRLMLSVIDRSSMALLQKLDISSCKGDRISYDAFLQNKLMLIPFSDGGFALLTEQEDGLFKKEFEGSFENADEIYRSFVLGSTFDYDGSRLAVAALINEYSDCGFYIAVFDKEGMSYAGSYSTSLDPPANYNFVFNNRVEPLDGTNSISLSLK